MAGEHFVIAESEEARRRAAVADGRKRYGMAALITRELNWSDIPITEVGEVKSLGQHEYVSGEIASASGSGLIVAAKARVGVRTRNPIDRPREDQSTAGIGDRQPRALC